MSVAPAWPPSLYIQPANFSENGPISGTNVRVRLSVTGCDFYWPHPVHAVLAGNLHERLRCIPDPGYPPIPSEDTIVTNFQGQWAGIVVIDSTGWNDGTAGGLLIRIAANGPRDSNAIPGIAVYNHGLVLGNRNFPLSSEVTYSVSWSLSDMRHGVEGSLNMEKLEILDNIPPNTVFYIDTHGGLDHADKFRFADCVSEGWEDPLHDIHESDVELAVGWKNPSQPPYNLVYMDACYSMDSGSAPGRWRIGDDLDEYYFGWHGFMWPTPQYVDFTERFFDDLQQGNWAEHARAEAAWSAGIPIDYSGYFGDAIMRLHWPYGSGIEFPD